MTSADETRTPMARKPAEIDILEAILKRNWGEGADEIDLRENESYHYFFFENIGNKKDLEAAWAVFPEHMEIRERLARVERAAKIVPGFGYRLPKEGNRCSNDELAKLIRQHIELVSPLVVDRPGYRHPSGGKVLKFVETPFHVVLAPDDVSCPSNDEADLWGVLREAISEAMFTPEPYPFAEKHYSLLHHWAEMFTKCQEVEAYLLWPCLGPKLALPDETPDPGFQLWAHHCRNRYWVKDSDFKSGIVYFRPPWLEAKTDTEKESR
jgi:hypothetical protein